jgi:hypothetical protein
MAIPYGCVAIKLLFSFIDHVTKIGGVNIVVNITISIGNVGILWGKTPFSIHNEFVPELGRCATGGALAEVAGIIWVNYDRDGKLLALPV